MKQYDKLIVDTSNIFFRVSAFDLKGLTQDKFKTLKKSGSLFETYKAWVQSLTTRTFGDVVLLFDPLHSKGGISERAKIKSEYKAQRSKTDLVSQLKIDTLTKLYNYFILEPQSRIKVYHSLEMEADDFAEKLTEKGNCLMITSDMDFSRYLESGRVDMMRSGLTITDSAIYTSEDFEKDKKHPFKPNIASVSLWKAFYGDESDNLEGVYHLKTNKVLREASDKTMEVIKEIGNHPEWSYLDLKRAFFNEEAPWLDVIEFLKLSNTNCSYEKLLNSLDDNFRVIDSLVPRTSDIDINKYQVQVDLKAGKEVTTKTKFTLTRRK